MLRLLHAVHLVCEGLPSAAAPAVFWCGDHWFDPDDSGGVVRTFRRTPAARLPRLRARPAPDWRLPAPAAPSSKAVSFAPAGGDGGAGSAGYLVVVYARAVAAGAVPITARLGVVLRGAVGKQRSRASPLVETALVCHPMGVARHAAAASAPSQPKGARPMFGAWSGRDYRAEAEREAATVGAHRASKQHEPSPEQPAAAAMEHVCHYHPVHIDGDNRQEIPSSVEATAAAVHVLDTVVGQAVDVATQAAAAASSALEEALGRALGHGTAGQAMVEALMGDVVREANEELEHRQSAAAAVQALTLPTVVMPPADGDDAEEDAAGLGEVHTVQLVDLDGNVRGDGAWVHVQGVEAVDVATGRGWWFWGDTWLPTGRSGLALRRQVDSLGDLIGQEAAAAAQR